MLRINTRVLIDDKKIECIISYDSEPLYKIARESRKKKNIREIRGRYGFKSMIVLEDGYVFLCPLNPDTYQNGKGISSDDYFIIDPKRYYIRRNCIREIVEGKLNKQQKREVKESKDNGTYINLAKNKKVKYYIFTYSGHIYGVNIIKRKEEILQ